MILYVNRATRQLGEGIALVEEMAAILKATEAPTEVLAASSRNLGEVVQAVQAGADP